MMMNEELSGCCVSFLEYPLSKHIYDRSICRYVSLSLSFRYCNAHETKYVILSSSRQIFEPISRAVHSCYELQEHLAAALVEPLSRHKFRRTFSVWGKNVWRRNPSCMPRPGPVPKTWLIGAAPRPPGYRRSSRSLGRRFTANRVEKSTARSGWASFTGDAETDKEVAREKWCKRAIK